MTRPLPGLLLPLVLAGAALACAMPGAPNPAKAGGMALPFIENDYALAVDRAREAHLPVFVEVWAPW